MSEWTDIIDGIADHIALLRELGASEIKLDPAVLAALDGKKPADASRPPTVSAPVPTSAQASRPMPRPAPIVQSIPAAANLSALSSRINGCAACPLCTARTESPAIGTGNAATPDVMFISDVPLAHEDLDLLHKMIGAMKYSPDDLYITSVCKCRPPAGRAPTQVEMTACMGILREHIRLLAPKTIVLLGEVATKGIFSLTPQFKPQLNHWIKVNERHIMPIRHPSHLRRFPATKHDAWHALQLVLAQLGRPLPPVKK